MSPDRRHVAPGIFEFRIDGVASDEDDRAVKITLRLMCHSFGSKVILLLAAYDKGANPSKRRQQSEIEVAKTRLAAWRDRRKRSPE